MTQSFTNVQDAARLLNGVAKRTPLLSCPALDDLCGAKIFLKAEPLQVTGSFKFRGAYNRLARLNEAERKIGVVAMSSGNHAQGVATAAKMLAMPACIIMPQDSPKLKLERTRAAGAEVITYNRLTEDRVAIAKAIAQQRGAIVVPPYDDPFILAGQGTAGLEIAEDLQNLGLACDVLLSGVSGGGLMAGLCLATHHFFPHAKIYTVEPEGFDDHKRSFVSNTIEVNTVKAGSLCDGLMADRPGSITFPVTSAHCAGGVVVSEEEVKRAVAFAFRELKLVVEPSGAVSLAALMHGKLDMRGKVVAAMLTGGNVDAELFAKIIQEH